MLQDRQKLFTHNDALTPVVASVLLLLMVAGCCTAIGIIVFQQMDAEESNAPDARIQTSAESKHFLYHAGGDTLYRNTITVYNLDNDITRRTLVNGKKDWTVWRSGEYLQSEQTLSDVYLVWHGQGKDVILYHYGINKKTGVTPITDAVPD
ncbi:type IV pilin N-terminal domain-containing protein [Methanocorpusculum sp. MG]|uniref:Type IV pilin N-terminal domain-containing protein n=1 Tax=Methanocorpusculum petauri TaxID=3002863 RepID=A0ABT4IDG1_9EURY|nr:type IV pilin N-terminal domain-containing protein [Methanocorpusculum petauri]MCZ0859779.1 type IV pilin N-terminal domain-containing protein [Methanocorpusculum petauri]